MYHDWKAGPSGQSPDLSAGISSEQMASLAARQAASDLLDECDEMARDMASASIERRDAKKQS